MTIGPRIVEPYNPNAEDASGTVAGFPVFDNVLTADQYANYFLNIGPSAFEQWCGSQVRELELHKSQVNEAVAAGRTVSKALTLPPEMQSFARFSLMPEGYNGNVIQWPGIPPEALRKVARENLAPQVIINMRVDDVLRYSTRSTHPWKPGWRITLRKGFDAPDSQTKADIQEAHDFIENCNTEKLSARKRDELGYRDFPVFLGELIRDALTFGPMSVFTDMDLKGRIKAFKALSSFNIRLCTKAGYMNDPRAFAVGVDEAGNVVTSFTRDQLIFRTRNSRADADIAGYDFPEIEQAVRLVQGFQNAIDLNADVFTRNAMPNGFLTAHGLGNQKQIDILSRIWVNLKRGVQKQWAVPVIPLPKDGKIEVVDLSRLKGMDAYYENWINMVAGLFCAMYRFPPHRLGYFTSGKGRDNRPPETPSTTSPTAELDDPYISVLLQHVENMINPYILWTRWPHLQFSFTGKSPKEDAREYEAMTLASTENERRALSDQQPLESLAGGDENMKKLLQIMGAAPVDPAMAGIYQSALTTVFGCQEKEGDQPGALMSHKKDPARAEDHGHSSGVRRDSAAEEKKSG
jgi:hypothetical protein